jgi:hypothetical protein
MTLATIRRTRTDERHALSHRRLVKNALCFDVVARVFDDASRPRVLPMKTMMLAEGVRFELTFDRGAVSQPFSIVNGREETSLSTGECYAV